MPACTVRQRSVLDRTAHDGSVRHLHCRRFERASAGARPTKKGVHDMVLKAFSYVMIGAFAGGLAMTVAGSAGVLLGL